MAESCWEPVSEALRLRSQLVPNCFGHSHLEGVQIQSHRVVGRRIESDFDIGVGSLSLKGHFLSSRQLSFRQFQNLCRRHILVVTASDALQHLVR